MKIFVTKYALTTGIYFCDAEINENCPRMVTVNRTKNSFNHSFFKPFWHDNEEDAIIHAESMRISKLKSLDKSIKKISALNFEDQIKDAIQ